MTHPDALTRSLLAIRATAPDWNGGMLAADAPPRHYTALQADGALIALVYARDQIRFTLRPARGRSMSFLDMTYRSNRRRLEIARSSIRSAAQTAARLQDVAVAA